MAYGRAFAWLGDHGRAEHAAQEAFVDAYLHLDQLREPAAFPGWFGRIVVKHSDRQSRSLKPHVSLDEAPGLTSSAPDPLEVVHSRQMGQIIHERIAQLSEEHQEAITLFHLEEYTQQEVSDFLDVPVSTVKKRLFDARKNLKMRMRNMTPPKVEENRPSQDDEFKRRAAFFIALRTRDFETLEKLIAQDSSLLVATTDNDVAPEMYWSRDITALFWAVQTSDGEMLTFLIKHGADVNASVRRTETPLHHSVMMDELDLAKLLIAAGADIEHKAGHGQTVLQRATIGGNLDLVELLLSKGASLGARDNSDPTAADWAVLKSRPEVLARLLAAGSPQPTVQELIAIPTRYADDGCSLNGRIIDVSERPLDGKGEVGPI